MDPSTSPHVVALEPRMLAFLRLLSFRVQG